MIEHRYTGSILHVPRHGRLVHGTLLPYRSLNRQFPEQFVPGCFGNPVPSVALNLQHDHGSIITEARDVVLIDDDDRLSIRAPIRPDSAAAKLLRRGMLSGFSIEFHSREERQENGVRVISKAELTGAALVDKGAYADARAELRQRAGVLGTLFANIPADTVLGCQCQDGCNHVSFDPGSLAGMLDDNANIWAALSNLGKPLGTTKKKNVRFYDDGKGGIDAYIDVPDTAAGRELLETADVTDLLARPYLRPDGSDFAKVAAGGREVAKYKMGNARGIVIGPSDADENWPAPVIKEEGFPDDSKEKPDAGSDLPEPPPENRSRVFFL